MLLSRFPADSCKRLKDARLEIFFFFFVPEEFKSCLFVKMASFGAIPFEVKIAVPLENGKAAREGREHRGSSTSYFSL